MKKISIGLLFLLSLGGLTWTQSGTIENIEGEVTIQRGGRTIPSSQIDIGTVVENFDLITTGKKSEVLISTNPRTGVPAKLFIRQSSVVQLELTPLRSSQTGKIDLIAGSVSTKVNKLLGGSGLEIRTSSAVMGVRGTEFTVVVNAGGDLLVTTKEGRVECSGGRGSVIFSEPGTVVEALGDVQENSTDLGPEEVNLKPRAVPVAALEGFERDWQAGRLEALRANGPRAIRNFAERYEKLVAQFNRTYDRMDRDILPLVNQWKNESAGGRMGSRAAVMGEKKKVIVHLMALRANTHLLERMFYRLNELKDLVDTGAVTGELRRGYSFQAFYQQFTRDRDQIQQKFNNIRQIMNLYALRNDGSVPLGDGGRGDLEDESSFFN